MKSELLSPAGNMESLKAAIQNGADAIYLGGKSFGARAYANNFNDEELRDAISYAHLYDVKIYVTINTLIHDKEIKELISYLKYLSDIDVDAVIVQDLGVITIIKNYFPDMVMHASTQMHIYDLAGIKMLENLGVKRVVLARETPLNVIKEIKENSNIEVEVFVHGALCISYSGQCQMSYLVGNRSGNRGECAGPCRREYELYENNKKIITKGNYLLSPKDLCLLDEIKTLMDLGIDCFKIEGRMKSPGYVGYTTRIYKKAMNNEEITIDEITNLKKLFNREFTKGHMFSENDYMNPIRPNHIGVKAGKVIKINGKTATIKLDANINQFDGIRLVNEKIEMGFVLNYLYQNGKLVNQARKGEEIEIELTSEGEINMEMFITSDFKLLKEIKADFELEKRKVLIKVKLDVLENSIILKANKNDILISIKKDLNIVKAINKPTTKEEISEKLNKLGDSNYKIDTLEINMPNDIFIPISKINDIRREMIKKLDEKRLERNKITIGSPSFKAKKYLPGYKYQFYVANKKQLITLLDKKELQIITDDYLLYNKYKTNGNVYFKYLSVRKNNYKIDKFIGSDLGNLVNNPKYLSNEINCFNAYSAYYLHNAGVNLIELNAELEITDIKELVNNYKDVFKKDPNLSFMVYGNKRAMITAYCPSKLYLNDNKIPCSKCKTNNYQLKDKFGNFYNLKQNNCLNEIYHYDKTNIINKISKLKEIGINTFAFYLDDSDDVIEILNLL